MNPADDTDILLLFPPFIVSALGSPYLSLPLLKGYLANHGIKAQQADLNIEFFNYIYNRANFEHVITNYNKKHRTAGNKDSFEEDAEYLEMMGLYKRFSLLSKAEKFKHRTAAFFEKYLLDLPLLTDRNTIETYVEKEHTIDSCMQDFFTAVIKKKILEAGPKIIAFTIPMFQQLIPAVKIAALIKKEFPRISILFGGASCNLMEESLLDYIAKMPSVDFTVKYGGAECLRFIVDSLITGQSVHRNDYFIENPNKKLLIAGTLFPGVNEGQYVDFDDTLLKNYPENSGLPLLLSYGCYWNKCSFCSYTKLFKQKYRIVPVAALSDLLEKMNKKYPNRSFYLIGECLPVKYGEKLADALMKNNITVTYNSFMRIEKNISKESLQKLARSGYKQATIGVESTNDRILASMDKGFEKVDIFLFIKSCHEAGIKVRINMIVDYPSTTYDQALTILDDLYQLKDMVHNISYNEFSLERETKIYECPSQYGISINDHNHTEKEFNRGAEIGFIDRFGMTSFEKALILQKYKEITGHIQSKSLRLRFENYYLHEKNLKDILYFLIYSIDLYPDRENSKYGGYDFVRKKKLCINQDSYNLILKLQNICSFAEGAGKLQLSAAEITTIKNFLKHIV